MRNKTIPKQVPVINYEKWYNKLPLDKQMYIANMVRKKVDKIHTDTTEILDSCYLGAMIEVLEMDLDTSIKIALKASENMQITQKILNSEKGNEYYMKVNNEEMRKQIKLEAKAMLKSNSKESTLTISRELEKEYKLPVKDLHILVAEARKELKEELKNQDAEKEKFLHNIGMEMQEILNKEVATDVELPYVIEEKELEEGKFIDVKDVVEELGVVEAEFKAPTTIKKVCETFRGANGTIYERSAEGVKSKLFSFKDITEVKDCSNAIEKEYKAKKEELYNKINELNKEMYELGKKRNEDFAIIAEIEEVFNA